MPSRATSRAGLRSAGAGLRSAGAGPVGERGAVTAELAIALPAVTLLVVLLVGAGQLLVAQQRLVVAAATVARALARGEDQAMVDEWVRQAGAKLKVSYGETLVCAELSEPSRLPGLEKFGALNVSENQCAQKQ